MVVMQLDAWTCGSLDPSVSWTLAGMLAILINSSMIFFRDISMEFADRVPVMIEGIPADRRVVDAWVRMQFRPPCSRQSQ
jgi:hypothetical protein